MMEKMQMEVGQEEIEVAHRLGTKVGTKPRAVVVRCQHALRQRIFAFTKNLKGKQNNLGDYYTVKPQLPEPLNTAKKEREDQLKHIRKENSLIPDEHKDRRKEAYIKGNTLYVDKIPKKTYVHPPTIMDMFNIDKHESARMQKLEFVHTDSTIEKGSSFTGHAIHLTGTRDVRIAYKKLRIMYPECDHIMMAYSVKGYKGHQDNGEYGAGQKLAHLLGSRKDTVVFVSRDTEVII